MKLTLETLRQVGAFTGGVVRREVEWAQNGEMVRAEVWVRPLSYQTATADINSMRAGDGPWPRRVALCICHEDGSPVFQLSDITGVADDGKPVMTVTDDGKEVERGGLNQALFDALMMVIVEVSKLGKTKASSNQKKNSGTSSSSTASAGTRSRKRKRV